MAALVAATEPGPWSTRTHELGEFVGVRVDGRLVAMAGQRMRLADAIEISAVCTDPDVPRAGLRACRRSRPITARTARAGRLPFLHVRDDNAAAIRVYERLGFRTARTLRPGRVPGAAPDARLSAARRAPEAQRDRGPRVAGPAQPAAARRDRGELVGRARSAWRGSARS